MLNRTKVKPESERSSSRSCRERARNSEENSDVPSLKQRRFSATPAARATIASALYNVPEGLGIGELGQWLGHKDVRSTQYYAKLHPTRLAKSISRANKNSRLAQVLVDPSAIAKGEPAIFYYFASTVTTARIRLGPAAHTKWPA
jgi:hypothetical protein